MELLRGEKEKDDHQESSLGEGATFWADRIILPDFSSFFCFNKWFRPNSTLTMAPLKYPPYIHIHVASPISSNAFSNCLELRIWDH